MVYSNDMSTAPGLTSTRPELAAAIRSESLRLTLRSLVLPLTRLVAWAALAMLVIVASDHLRSGGLPGWGIRMAGRSWMAGVAVIGLAILVAAAMRRFNPLFVARQLERSRGIAHNVLINFLFLERDPHAHYALPTAAAQALAKLHAPDDQPEWSRPRPRIHGAFPAAVLLAWLVFAFTTPKPIGPSIARALGAGLPPPSATRIELVRPGPSDVLYAGEPATLAFAIHGRPVEHLWFELVDPSDAGGAPIIRRSVGRGTERTASPVAAGDSGDVRVVSLAANEVASGLWFRCAAGDAGLEGPLPVQPLPQVIAHETEVLSPPYLGLTPRTSSDPEIRAWAGSQAHIRVMANGEIRTPILVYRGDREMRMRMTVDPTNPRSAYGVVVLENSGEYWVEFTDSWGRGPREPARHAIVVRADAPPLVEITEPGHPHSSNAAVDVADVPWVRVAASDDVQLAGLWLVCERSGVAKRTELLAASGAAERSVQVGVASSDLELKPGESVRVWFEARDNRARFDATPAPQVSASRTLTLTRRRGDAAAQRGSADVSPPAQGQANDSATTVVSRKRTVAADAGSGGGDGRSDSGAAASSGDDASDNATQTDRPTGRYTESPDGQAANLPGDSPDARADGSAPAGDKSDAPDATVDSGGSASPGGGGREGDGGEGPHDGPRSHSRDEFENDVKRFVEEHASDIDAARQSLRGDGGPRSESTGSHEDATDRAEDGQGADPPWQRPSEPSAADPPQANDPASRPTDSSASKDPRPETDPGEGGDASPKSGPEGQPRHSEGESKPASQKAAVDAKDRGPDGGAAPPTTPSDPAGESIVGDPPSSPADGEPTLDGSPNDRATSPGERIVPTGRASASPESAGVDSTPELPGRELDAPLEARPERVGVLELIERADSLDEESFADLPWSIEKKRAFVRDLVRLQESARRAGVLSDVKRRTALGSLGSSEVQTGRGLSAAADGAIGAEALLSDGLPQFSPPADQQVAPALRGLLDAYYRSMARWRDNRGAERTPPP